MRFSRAFRASFVALALVGLPWRALADESSREPSAEDRALATTLFKEGRKLLDEGKVADACRKLEESQRLDPGGGTLLNLAACHEREGRTASAWTEFTGALALARRDGRADRAAIAEERVTALEKDLSRLTIVVPAEADRDDLEITLDGSPVRRPAWGVALPVDPGSHAIVARAPKAIPWSREIAIGPHGDAHSLRVPPLEAVREEPTPPLAAAPAPAPSEIKAAPAPHAPVLRDGAMIASAAVGLAGIALGSYFGLHAMALERDAKSGCPGGRCTNDAVATSGRATTSADVSTASFAVGALGLGVATVLFFTRPPPVDVAAGPHGASIAWTGRF